MAKLSSDDFAQSIKTKYPQYAAVDNATLTQKMIAKYPQYADKVDMGGGISQPPTGGGSWLPQNLADTPSWLGKGITNAGVGVGTSIGKGGLALGQLATQAVGGLAGMVGAKGVQQGAQQVASSIGDISTAMYDQPQFKAAQSSLPGIAGTVTGEVAQLFTGGGAARNVAAKIPAVSEKLAQRDSAKILEMVSPNPTKVPGSTAIEKGKGIARTFFSKGGVSYATDKFVQASADAVKGFVDTSKGIQANVNNILGGISKISESVAQTLSGKMQPFHFQDLRDYFSMVHPSESIKADPSAVSTYARVGENMLQNMYNQLQKSGEKGAITDWNEIWKARTAISDIANNELRGKLFGSPEFTGIKAAARDHLTALKDYIVGNLKFPGQGERFNQFSDFLQTAHAKGMNITNEDDAIKLLQKQMGLKSSELDTAVSAYFSDSMDRMSSMYDAVHNMAPKAFEENKISGAQALIQHPLTKIAGALTVGTGVLGGIEAGIHTAGATPPTQP